MKWILILGIPWGSALSVDGVSLTTATFDDQRACEAALDKAKAVRRWKDRATPDGLCVPSASEEKKSS
ncbi:hypothetical protein METUNv1_00525 [Methyloversatilis universalis FAM5]|uniref:Uncharacterized protein n=2 Tax=Methyloversatilis universalis TaxID=378211 RepID=F5R889_METUF|nr:hypothetical protein METUNv1_00525 [Methyloversatilis universalis FAM5]